jgi:hypothetical protein
MTKPKAAGVQPRGMVLTGDIVHPELRDGSARVSGYLPGRDGGVPRPETMQRWNDPAFQTRSDEISADDRDWFAAHPGRRCRIRPARDGESPIAGVVANEHVIVLQIKPGTRFRYGTELNELVPDEDAVLQRLLLQGLRRDNPQLWRGIKKMLHHPERYMQGVTL